MGGPRLGGARKGRGSARGRAQLEEGRFSIAARASDGWLHEIKYDGFHVIARKDGERVRLYSRPGNDLTYRFTLIVEALVRLRSRSCIIDGEAVCCGDDGVPNFDRIRYRRHDASVFLYAFDLIELRR
jgi:bifunctional non-homologous end joining protein LigD